jgi:trimethylamine--corrinoid protein Co-methyltransferase
LFIKRSAKKQTFGGDSMARRNISAGFNQISGFGLNMFSEDELYAIHCATLDVLQHTGIKIISKEAQDIYDGGGAIVDRKNNIGAFFEQLLTAE